MTKRLAAMGQTKYQGLLNEHGRFNGTIKFSEEDLLKPLRWKTPRKIFVNSMSDLFHENVLDEMIDKAFAVMALCPQHTFQILTKRPGRMHQYFDRLVADVIAGALPKYGSKEAAFRLPLANVWLGVSVEDQKTADERIPLLLDTPAAVRWISAEPLLGPINIRSYLHPPSDTSQQNTEQERPVHLNWAVIGGESGPGGARPCDIAHIRSIVEQCKSAGVPVFVKQLGANPVDWRHDVPDAPPYEFKWDLSDRKGGNISEFPVDLQIREFPKVLSPEKAVNEAHTDELSPSISHGI